VGLLVAEPVQANQGDHRVSLEAEEAEDMMLVVVAAEEDRAAAWFDNLAEVEEGMILVFGYPIAVEEHRMCQLFEFAVVALAQEAFSNCPELTRV
jgi:hypothetical protein